MAGWHKSEIDYRLIPMTKLIAMALILISPLTFSEPKAIDTMSTKIDNLGVVQTLIDQHFEIWNDASAQSWPAKYSTVYADDFFVADESGQAQGYESVTALIRKVQAEHIGFVFTPEPVQWNHGVGRVTWGYGPKDKPNLVRGEDIFTISDGKLSSARVFINK